MRRSCFDLKKREMTGSGIFNTETLNQGSNSAPGVRLYQQSAGTDQISFGMDGIVSPKKPPSLTEVAKQKELSETQDSAIDVHHSRKQYSLAKSKELSGHDIFGNLEPKETKEPEEPAPRNVSTSVKVSNPAGGLVHNQKVTELTKPVSVGKLREMSGSDIFEDEKPVSRGRKPPGGETTIALV